MTEREENNSGKPDRRDRFGITEVFIGHLEMSLAHMHPAQAFESAQHAVRHYLASYEFVEMGHKEGGIPEYHMVPKRKEKIKGVFK